MGFFLALGILWRFLKPNGITADSLKKSINALVLWVLLPLVVFFTMYDLPLNEAALRILLYVLGTTLIALGVAWFWLSKTALSAKTRGAYLIAAVFGNVLFLGLPLNKMLFSDWTMRIAIEYMLVANVLLLFTAGAIFAKNLASPGKTSLGKTASEVFNDYRKWLKEPIIWAAILGWLFNLADAGLPGWANQISAMLYGVLIPLLLFSVGLSLNWTPNWNNQLVGVAPVVVIQLILVPLLMWGMATLFGSAGLQTTKSLLLDSMLPATLFGFVMCERYKLDTEGYALAFTASSVLALVTVPIWYNIIL
jgi:predicted permease